MKANRIALIGLFSLLIPVLTVIFISAAIYVARDWFNITKHALSDLGATTVNSFLIFNSGLIVVGLITVMLAILVIWESIPTRKLRIIPTAILLMAGIFLIGIGIFPLDTAPVYHGLCAISFFILLGISMLAFGVYCLYYKELLLGVLGVLGFIVSYVVWVLIPWSNLNITGVAIPEVLSITPPNIWLLVLYRKVSKNKSLP